MQEVDSIGYENYNSLLIKFQRQYSNGLSILANYNYSKALAAAQEGGNGTLNQRRSCLIGCDYGLTTFDVPQSLVLSAVWELPFGKGRHYGNSLNPALDVLAGGWDLDAIATMQRGNPYTLTAPNNTAWSPGQIRANTYCDGRAKLTSRNLRTNGHYLACGPGAGKHRGTGQLLRRPFARPGEPYRPQQHVAPQERAPLSEPPASTA